MAGSSSSAWAALSHLPRGPFSGPPKTMTPAQMLAPLPAAPFSAAAAEWDDAAEAQPRSPSAAADAAASGGGGGGGGGAPRSAQPPRFIEHRLEKRDTLLGLSLRYGVSAAELRLANDMPQSSDNLSACGPTLRVPAAASGRAGAPSGRPAAPEAESARAVLRRFRVAHALLEAEAKYYLSLCDGDFDAASRELAQDLEVERRLGGSGAAAAAAGGSGVGVGGVSDGGGGSNGGGSSTRHTAPAPRAASKLEGEGSTLLDVEDGEDGEDEEEEGSKRPGSALRKRR